MNKVIDNRKETKISMINSYGININNFGCIVGSKGVGVYKDPGNSENGFMSLLFLSCFI